MLETKARILILDRAIVVLTSLITTKGRHFKLMRLLVCLDSFLGLGAMIHNQYHKYPPLFGFGIPLRTQNYIMGETKPLGGNNSSN